MAMTPLTLQAVYENGSLRPLQPLHLVERQCVTLTLVAEPEATPPTPSQEALARWDAIASEVAADPRPFSELSPEERLERHRRLKGIGKGLLPSSEEVARAKREDVELEESKFAR